MRLVALMIKNCCSSDRTAAIFRSTVLVTRPCRLPLDYYCNRATIGFLPIIGTAHWLYSSVSHHMSSCSELLRPRMTPTPVRGRCHLTGATLNCTSSPVHPAQGRSFCKPSGLPRQDIGIR